MGKITEQNTDIAVGERIVRRYNIIGTHLWVHDVYEPYAGHGTQSIINGVKMGRVGTKRPPANTPLPRIAEYYSDQYHLAYTIIRVAFPKISRYVDLCQGGHIETIEE
jgi:hypothetical protein